MAFKKGDVIICVRAEHFQKLTDGKEYVVNRIPRGNLVEITNDAGIFGMYFTNRFVLKEQPAAIIPPAPAIQVGSKVICVNGLRNARLHRGIVYTVKSIGPKNGAIYLHEIPALGFAAKRFVLQPVENPAVVPVPAIPRKFKEGDEVICFKEAGNENFGWNENMRMGILDKKVLKVKIVYGVGAARRYVGHATLSDHFIYPRSSLVFANTLTNEDGVVPPELAAGVGMAAPAPVAPKPPKKSPLDKMREKVGKDNSHLNAFAIAFKDNDEVQYELGAPCYWRAQNNTGGKVEAFVFSIRNAETYINNALDEGSSFRKWAEYVLYRSPMSDVFIQEDWDTYAEKGVMVDVNKTLSQICAAAIWIREGYEFRYMLPTFAHFLTHGYGENTAFLMAHTVKYNEKKECFDKIAFGCGGHKGISGNGNFLDTIKFFQQGFHVDNKENPACEGISNYKIFASIARIHSGESFDQVASNHLVTKEVGEGFDRKKVLENETVYNFAEFLHKQIN